MFEKIPEFPGDPILSLTEIFHKDPRQDKVNLGIGVYFDDDGELPVMEAVRLAASSFARIESRPYQPMEGLSIYRAGAQELLFGPDHEAVISGRIATLQTLGGSGALKVGADFIKTHFHDVGAWVSDPTWDNHRAIFEGSGFEVEAYPYYDTRTRALRFEEMLECFSQLPRGSLVVLHACCHNPTGVDLTRLQWLELIPVLRERGLIAFVDIAYQGFGAGVVEDAFAIRAMANSGLRFLVASSFSKNFSLYGERCGSLSVVCADRKNAEIVLGQLTAMVRRNYSSPPTSGAQIISHVLCSSELSGIWRAELATMRERMRETRRRLHENLSRRMPEGGFSYLLDQQGMFTFTGLTKQQVASLRDRHGVYLIGSGRLCIAGLRKNCEERVAQAIELTLRAGPEPG